MDLKEIGWKAVDCVHLVQTGLVSSEYRGFFPRGSGQAVKLSIHLHLVPKLRIRGAIPPLPHTSSLRGA